MTWNFAVETPESAGLSAAVLGELDRHADTLITTGQAPGVLMLLARGDRIVYGRVAGYDDVERGTLLKPDSIFRLFSMSKPFAAVAMLLLHEEGKWQLDDPVARHVPETAGIAARSGGVFTREPVLRDLFTHTSGFSFGATVEEMRRGVAETNWSTARSLHHLIELLAARPLAHQPGTDWQYGLGMDLQAQIVERISGQRYDVFLEQRVFGPLGMADTRFVLDQPQTNRLAARHVIDPVTGRLRRATGVEEFVSIFPMGGSSFHGTAMDYLRFGRMLLNRGTLGDAKILAPESVDLMFANHLAPELLARSWPIVHYTVGGGNGFGMNGLVCLDPAKAGRPVGRGTYEWGGAYGTWFWADPENDIVFVGMTNRQRSPTDLRPLDVVSQDIVYRALRAASGAAVLIS